MPADSFIVVGDIHGCLKSLEALMRELEPHADRTHVFLGDYIDRGPDSYGVVEYLLEFSRGHDCVFLRGNHEQMLIDALMEGDAESWAHWLHNGGTLTMDSYRRHGLSPMEARGHADFYVSTEMYFDTPGYLFVHGGVNPFLSVERNLAATDPYEFLWERRHLDMDAPKWEKTVVFGHTPMQKPLLRPPMVGLDTGCVFADRGYGKLSALLLPEMRVIDCTCKDLTPP